MPRLLAELRARIAAVQRLFDAPERAQMRAWLHAESLKSDLWSDQARAQAIHRRLAHHSADADLLAVAAAGREVDAQTIQKIDQLERRLRLIDPEAERRAIVIVEIVDRKGRGLDPDYAATAIVKMYMRWAARAGMPAEVVPISVRSLPCVAPFVLEVNKRYAFGLLQGEDGLHCLEELSRKGHRESRTVRVRVVPMVDDNSEVDIPPKDLTITTMCSRSDRRTTVSVAHLPSGLLLVSEGDDTMGAQAERSLVVLRACLHGRKKAVAVMNPPPLIRTYRLAPKPALAVDARSGRTIDARRALDGELDDFIDAQLGQGLEKV